MNILGRLLWATSLSLVLQAERIGSARSGGDTTVFQEGQNAYSLPLANLDRVTRRTHVVGNSFFNKNWVPAPGAPQERDGLGPLYNATSCSSCHIRDGRGRPTRNGKTANSLLFRLAIPASDSNSIPVPDPIFGRQLATPAIAGVPFEGRVSTRYQSIHSHYDDGTPFGLRSPHYRLEASENDPIPPMGRLISPRLAPPVFGLGLLEAIPEETLLEFADPADGNGDGISGRPNRVRNPETDRIELGRFGWKANQATLRQQIASAFLNDLGITSSLFPSEALSPAQSDRLQHLPNGGAPEISDHIFNRVLTYQRTLAPPARRNIDAPLVRRGEALFRQLDCHSCHRPELKTGQHPTIQALSDQAIRPFTDLLLHDMGPGLADGKPDHLASGFEWRTPPLWGIGLPEAVNGPAFYLHDGRARSLEEAILWHGGEARHSKEKFKRSHADERAALIAFLNSL